MSAEAIDRSLEDGLHVAMQIARESFEGLNGESSAEECKRAIRRFNAHLRMTAMALHDRRVRVVRRYYRLDLPSLDAELESRAAARGDPVQV